MDLNGPLVSKHTTVYGYFQEGNHNKSHSQVKLGAILVIVLSGVILVKSSGPPPSWMSEIRFPEVTQIRPKGPPSQCDTTTQMTSVTIQSESMQQ